MAHVVDGEKTGSALDSGTVMGEAPFCAMSSVPKGFGCMFPTTLRCKHADMHDEKETYSKAFVAETCPLHS